MISVDVCQNGTKVTQGVEAERISDFLQDDCNLLWVDVNSPDDDAWDKLRAEFDFHPLAIEDAKSRNSRPKIDEYPNFIFLTVRTWQGVNTPTADVNDATQELDIFLGPNYLVTVHDNESPLLNEIRKRWESHPDRTDAKASTLLHILLDTVVDSYFPAMDAIDGEIDDIELAVYDPNAMVELGPAISIKKRLLILRQIVAPMRDVLNHLLRLDNPLIPHTERMFYHDVFDHVLRLVEQIDLHRDILGGVMDAVMAQTNNRLNQVMKTLTAISTILMSAALITGIYGMNFKHMPELEKVDGYPFALGAMVIIAISIFLYFRKIKWL